MKIQHSFNSNNGKRYLQSKASINKEIKNVFSQRHLIFQKGCTKYIKMEILMQLTNLGWADSIKIPPRNISINYMKERIGLCLQLGNIARTYADLLKLQLFYQRKIIDLGIIAVPMKDEARLIGCNIAQYERLSEEIKLFNKIITIPMIVFGLTNTNNK